MLARPFRDTLLALALAVALAGCGEGDDEPEAGAPAQDAQTISVVGQDNLSWDAEELTASAGEIEVILTCEGGVNHNFTIEEAEELVAECAPDETVTGTVELEAGEYTYVCTVPGHEATMRGVLSVS